MALVSGSTYLFRLTAYKDGTLWNLTGATVTLYIQPRGGTLLTKTATVTSAAGGIAEYQSAVGDIESGSFVDFCWEVSQSGIVQRSEIITRSVADTLS